MDLKGKVAKMKLKKMSSAQQKMAGKAMKPAHGKFMDAGEDTSGGHRINTNPELC